VLKIFLFVRIVEESKEAWPRRKCQRRKAEEVIQPSSRRKWSKEGCGQGECQERKFVEVVAKESAKKERV
jgi:hypothetical protein